MCPLHARWLPLAGFLCSLVLFRGPPFASSSASVFCWRGFFLDSPTPVALLAGSLRSASSVLFSVSGLSALVPVVQVCLRAARVFCLVDGSLSVALSGAPGFQSFFSFSSAQISLSLSAFLAPASRPWGFTGWGLFLSWLLCGLDCPSPSHGGLPIGFPAFLSGSLLVALSHLPGGVRLFCFAGRTSSPFFWFVRGVRCSSWLSPLHSARFWFVVFSVVCGWVGALLPSLRPCTRSLSLWPVGCFPVSSVTLRSCVLSWSLGFSIPWQFPRPELLFPGSRTLPLPLPWYSRWHLDPAFCSSRVLHPTLSHVFATAFPTVQLVPRFSLLLTFLTLFFYGSQSCLGLQ